MPYIRSGKVKAYAVTTSKRLTTPALSKLPTLDESGLKGFNVSIWHGMYAPKGTPLIGPTPLANLFLNCGHGALGWTLALGSAHVVADLIAGRARTPPRHRQAWSPRAMPVSSTVW